MCSVLYSSWISRISLAPVLVMRVHINSSFSSGSCSVPTTHTMCIHTHFDIKDNSNTWLSSVHTLLTIQAKLCSQVYSCLKNSELKPQIFKLKHRLTQWSQSFATGPGKTECRRAIFITTNVLLQRKQETLNLSSCCLKTINCCNVI